MSDLEQRLSEALSEGAEGAPAAAGLAEAARSRARSRRRSRITLAAAAVALCIAVPTVVAARGSDQAGPGPSDATTPASTPTVVPVGQRVESWHGVSITVPDRWGYGSLSDWCAAGGALTPRVQRPGTVSNDIKCDPQSTYGIAFQEIDNGDDFQWPVVQQDPKSGYPPGAYVGARGIGGVLVMVTAPTRGEGLDVLATMRSIGPEGDRNGCQSRLGPDAARPATDAVSVCRYDETGELEQSEVLVGDEADRAVAALQAAPDPGECADTSRGSQPHEVVVMAGSAVTATVDLVDGCPRVTVGGEVRDLTPDVLHWALSPGWSGSLPDGVSLPSGLRTN